MTLLPQSATARIWLRGESWAPSGRDQPLAKALDVEHIAKVRQGHGEIGLDQKGLAIARHRLVQATQGLEDVAEIAAGAEVVGVDVERPAVATSRLLDPAQGLEDVAEVVVGRRGVGVERQALAVEGFRLVEPAGLMMVEGHHQCALDVKRSDRRGGKARARLRRSVGFFRLNSR